VNSSRSFHTDWAGRTMYAGTDWGWVASLAILTGCGRPPQAPAGISEPCAVPPRIAEQAPPSDGTGDWGAYCDSQKHCRVGLSCSEGTCEPPPGCCSDDDCQYGCRNGRCEQPVPQSLGSPLRPHVFVNSGGTLRLSSGDYYFLGLTINSSSTVRINDSTGPARIFVANTFACRSFLPAHERHAR